MAIYRLMAGSAFAPDDIKVMATAFEEALRVLELKDRDDPVTEMIAKKIIELAQTGLRDPIRLRTAALKDLGIPGVN